MSESAPRRKRLVPILVAIVLVGVIGLRLGLERPGPDEVFHSLADELVYYILGQKHVQPELYANDPWIDLAEQVFPPWYQRSFAPLTISTDQPLHLAWGLSLLSCGLFLGGAFALVRRLTGSTTAGALMVAFWFVPGAGDYLVGPVDSLPRDFFFAAFPWLLLGLLAAGERPGWKIAAAGFALGLLTNVHPLSGLHFAILLGPMLLFGSESPRAGFLRAALFTAGFFAGVVPYLLQWASLPRPGPISETAMALRVPGVLSPPVGRILAKWGPIALLAAAPAFLRLPGIRHRRPLIVLCIAAVVLGFPGTWLGSVSVSAAQFQLGRILRVAGFLALAVTAALLAKGLADRRRTLLAASALALVLLGTIVPQKTLFTRAGRRIFGPGLPDAREADPRPHGPELMSRSVEDRRSYRAIARWARDHTAVDARFLVPPEKFSAFRFLARRALVVSRKEGGFVTTFMASEGERWHALYREVSGIYARSDTEALLALARREDAQYVLSEAPWSEFDLPAVHREGPFVLHKLPAD
jgi:hypothetical protein